MYYGRGNIIIGETLQEAMLKDFVAEYEQQRKLGNVSRMRVIESSIEEIKLQIKNPERHSKMIHGGYSEEEMRRINQLPKNLNGV